MHAYHPTMPAAPRQLLERRIWRLGYLVTGNELAAAELVDRVFRAHGGDVYALDPPRLDRLIIQQAREMLGTWGGAARTGRRKAPPSLLMDKAPAEVQRAFAAVQSLPEQPREAWVLAKIDELDDLHISRAMDCSKTATLNHLNAAEAQVRAALADDYDRALVSLRTFADTLDPRPIIATARARRQQQLIRRAGILAIFMYMLILLGMLVWLKNRLG
jgi:hypothetical protein